MCKTGGIAEIHRRHADTRSFTPSFGNRIHCLSGILCNLSALGRLEAAPKVSGDAEASIDRFACSGAAVDDASTQFSQCSRKHWHTETQRERQRFKRASHGREGSGNANPATASGRHGHSPISLTRSSEHFAQPDSKCRPDDRECANAFDSTHVPAPKLKTFHPFTKRDSV
jgi:hypothetical protein